MTTPLLILSDAVSSTSGLGRIAKDLAVRVHEHLPDIYDVGTLGYGGCGDRELPFPQYFMEGMENWYIPTLEQVWANFAGSRRGIVMTIWDASRLVWFARPDNPDMMLDPRVRAWLKNAPFERWMYAPMDASGPNHQLSVMTHQTLLGYDRVLAYSKWAERIITNTVISDDLKRWGLAALPHGIDTKVFSPQRVSRSFFKDAMGFSGPPLQPEEKIIGIVATNQARKDFGLAVAALRELAQEMPIRLYIQVDTLERHWSIPALLHDFGMVGRSILNTGIMTDSAMAQIYSLCDVTLGIGAGEGFGYPLFESLACGTPVVTGNYGGHAEWFTDEKMGRLVEPQSYRLEGVWNQVRPVFDPSRWVYAIQKVLAQHKPNGSLLPEALDWDRLWPHWEAWFRKGVSETSEAADRVRSPESRDSTPETDTAQSDPSMSPIASEEVS